MSARTVAAWVGRIALTVLLLWWIFSRPDLRAGFAEVRFAQPLWLVAALAAAVAAAVLGALRWQACLRASACELPFPFVLRAHLYGSVVGVVSIGALGADATRVALAARKLPGRTAALAAAVTLDHVVAIPTILVGGIVIALSMQLSTAVDREALTTIALVTAGIAAAAVAVRVFFPAWHFRAMSYIAQVARSPQTALAALVAVPMAAAYYGIFFCVARALAVEAPSGGLAGSIVIADTIASLPVTIAGLGVREKSFEFLLGRWYDVPAALAVMSSLTGFVVLATVAAVGALLLPVRAEPTT